MVLVGISFFLPDLRVVIFRSIQGSSEHNKSGDLDLDHIIDEIAANESNPLEDIFDTQPTAELTGRLRFEKKGRKNVKEFGTSFCLTIKCTPTQSLAYKCPLDICTSFWSVE